MQFEISFRLFVAEVFFSTFEMCLIVEKCAYCNYAQDTAKSVLYYAEHLCYSHCIRSIHAPVQLVQPDIHNVAQHSNGIVLCGIRLLLFCCIPRRRYHFVCYQMAVRKRMQKAGTFFTFRAVCNWNIVFQTWNTPPLSTFFVNPNLRWWFVYLIRRAYTQRTTHSTYSNSRIKSKTTETTAASVAQILLSKWLVIAVIGNQCRCGKNPRR